MLLLASTSDKLQLVTGSVGSVDVHASYVDGVSSIVPGRKNTAITTATTTDIVLAPGSSVFRTIKTVTVRNKHATNSNVVTVVLTDGTTAVELYSALLGPGAALHYHEGAGFFTETRISNNQAPWETTLIGACEIDPGEQMMAIQRAGNVAATPTNISTSVARCSLFVPLRDITINRIRWYGVGATTNVYRVALYRYSDLARLTSELAFTTAANTWGSVDAGGVALSAGVPYFVACSVNATGTTAGVGCFGGTVAATTGQIATAPGSLPGNMSAGSAYLGGYFFQFAVTTGALPNPAATLAAQAAWTGGMPAFWLDNNTAA